MPDIVGHTYMFVPLYKVIGTVTKIFPIFVHALPCVALRLVCLAVVDLLVHVTHSLA